MSCNNAKRDEIFTPFSRIPPIGSKIPKFKNFRVGSTAMELGMRHPTFPVRKRKLQSSDKEASKKPSEAGRLLRRKTYVVLEPLICKSDKGGKDSL